MQKMKSSRYYPQKQKYAHIIPNQLGVIFGSNDTAGAANMKHVQYRIRKIAYPDMGEKVLQIEVIEDNCSWPNIDTSCYNIRTIWPYKRWHECHEIEVYNIFTNSSKDQGLDLNIALRILCHFVCSISQVISYLSQLLIGFCFLRDIVYPICLTFKFVFIVKPGF